MQANKKDRSQGRKPAYASYASHSFRLPIYCERGKGDAVIASTVVGEVLGPVRSIERPVLDAFGDVLGLDL